MLTRRHLFSTIRHSNARKFTRAFFLFVLISTLLSYILVRRTPDFNHNAIPRNELTLKKFLESTTIPSIKAQPKVEPNFIKSAVIYPYSDEEISKSVLATSNILFFKELGYPLIYELPKNEAILPILRKTATLPELSLSILREKDVSLISILPITKFSTYPLPKTEDNLFESISSSDWKPAMEKLKNMCGTTTFREFLYNNRVYLDNSSLKLKWMFCKRDFLESRKSSS